MCDGGSQLNVLSTVSTLISYMEEEKRGKCIRLIDSYTGHKQIITDLQTDHYDRVGMAGNLQNFKAVLLSLCEESSIKKNNLKLL